MTRHVRPADIRLADFLAVSVADEVAPVVVTRQQLLADYHAAFDLLEDALCIHNICLEDGTLRDVTEDMALAWYDEFGGANEALPAIFASFLEDRQHKDREAAEDRGGIIARGEREYEERAGK